MPQSFSGNAYIFAVTDAGSQVYERSLENNNVGSTVNSFLVTLAQPTDLVVGTITIPSDAVAGRNITIGYTVNNQGLILFKDVGQIPFSSPKIINGILMMSSLLKLLIREPLRVVVAIAKQ